MRPLETLALYGHQTCTTCGKNKLLSRFALNGPTRTKHECNSCRATRPLPKHAQQNKEALDKARSAPCADCGKTYPIICMDFDHLPQHPKAFNLSTHWKTLQHSEIMQEVAKCEVVCSNCHRIRTATRPHKRGFGYNQVSPLFPPTKDTTRPIARPLNCVPKHGSQPVAGIVSSRWMPKLSVSLMKIRHARMSTACNTPFQSTADHQQLATVNA